MPIRGDETPHDDAYLSVRSLARYSDLSIRTLRTYLAHPTRPIPHFKMQGKILVKRSEFDAWMLAFRSASNHSASENLADELFEAVR
jgi:hypothetical protein